MKRNREDRAKPVSSLGASHSLGKELSGLTLLQLPAGNERRGHLGKFLGEATEPWARVLVAHIQRWHETHPGALSYSEVSPGCLSDGGKIMRVTMLLPSMVIRESNCGGGQKHSEDLVVFL